MRVIQTNLYFHVLLAFLLTVAMARLVGQRELYQLHPVEPPDDDSITTV